LAKECGLAVTLYLFRFLATIKAITRFPSQGGWQHFLDDRLLFKISKLLNSNVSL
jgi:hypothetical protein